jgi:sn-glycerol 3-phosphate transport system substrate-binding protein
MKLFKVATAFSLMAMVYTAPAFSKVDIQFWHGLSGQTAEYLNDIVNDFNKSQNEYQVTAVKKGTYQETMMAGIAAFRAKKQPDIIQVYEVGTATMIAAKGATIPISKLMSDNNVKLDTNDIIPAVKGYYSQGETLLSFPLNSSSPVMYYNNLIFKKAGLDPNTPPKTWDELYKFAEKIKTSGAAPCGFTTTWPAWIQLENFSAWHNVPYATESNGMDSKNPKLSFNSETQVLHWKNLQKANKSGYFTYYGRTTEAEMAFSTQKCGIYFDSTGSYGEIKDAKLDFSVAKLPYYQDITGAPQNTIIGGASLWVFNGIPKEKQKAAAVFIAYLSNPEVMAKWHQTSGYLPVTNASYHLTKSLGFYKLNSGYEVAISELNNKAPTQNSKGLRIFGLPNIRNIVEANFESMLSGKITAQKALDDAVEKGNAIIKKSGE